MALTGNELCGVYSFVPTQRGESGERDARINPNSECPLHVRLPYDSGAEADLKWGKLARGE